ncbi:MAG: sensor histidine kinase, partial [Ktedonobacteraceae bacterium]
RRRLDGEGSTLQLEVGHIEPVRVRGDEESLRRVLLILLDNAMKYTPLRDEEGANRIIVSLEQADGQAVLHVRDTGIGIEAADLPHIFERFYRADRARARQGTGLGLSIAQTLVERLGGRITAESTVGKGSIFSVWLPLA